MVAKYAGILHIGMRNMEDYSLLKTARNREGADPMNELMNVFESIAHGPIKKRAITNLGVLNEAYAYARPSSFSRGLRIDLNGLAILLISGTASIDENGKSVHIGDFRAQARRIFANISGLLQSEGCTWHDVVRTTCYLRDIERDYEAFNEERTAFYKDQGLDPLPASTGIQAILCRPELLLEIEVIAMFRSGCTGSGEQ
jgi:2-iminobutanoate/2-iminopropanoate deaminase